MYTSISSEEWKLIHGQNTGISQFSSPSEHLFVWNFPFEFMYEIRSPSGWPQIVIVLYGKDYFGRTVARGYGNVHLPSAAGSHIRKVKIF